jgi:hypothetical protein
VSDLMHSAVRHKWNSETCHVLSEVPVVLCVKCQQCLRLSCDCLTKTREKAARNEYIVLVILRED